MTTTHPSRSRSLTVLRTGVALAALIAVVDVAGLFLAGIGHAPIEVVLLTSTLALLTLAAVPFAWHRAAWAVWIAAVTRGLAALGAIPLLVVPEAPKDAIPMAIVSLVLTAVALVMLVVGLRSRH